MSIKQWFLLSLCLFPLSGMAESKANKPTEMAAKVMTKPVSMVSNQRVFEANGNTLARQSALLYPAVAEQVTKVLFQPQQSVKAGQLLLQLDDRQQQLALAQAELNWRDAEKMLARHQQLMEVGGIAQRELEQSQLVLEQARLARDQARLELEKRQLRAPFAGVIGINNVNVGERVTTTTVVASLDDRRLLFVDFEVPESLMADLLQAQNQKQLFQLSSVAFPNQKWQAAIYAIDNRLLMPSRSVKVRLALDNKQDLFRPGMSLQVRWPIAGKTYPAVPEIALQWAREGSFVWAVREGKAAQVLARVVARRDGLVLLDGPLQVGEPVVIEGLQRVKAGKAVEILGQGKAK